MSARGNDGSPAAERPGYEQARDELVEIVRRLEAGGVTLEESLELWERGEQLAKICQDWLDGARERLEAAARDSSAEGGGQGPQLGDRRASGDDDGERAGRHRQCLLTSLRAAQLRGLAGDGGRARHPGPARAEDSPHELSSRAVRLVQPGETRTRGREADVQPGLPARGVER